MTVGTSPEDAHTRRIVVEVVSNTLSIAMERAGPNRNVFGQWMAVLDEAKDPDEQETPPASDEDLRALIADARRESRIYRRESIGRLIGNLASHLENEMLDAMHLRAQLACMSDKANYTIIRTIYARLARLRGQVAPDESHPAEDVVEALKDDLVRAVTEALR